MVPRSWGRVGRAAHLPWCGPLITQPWSLLTIPGWTVPVLGLVPGPWASPGSWRRSLSIMTCRGLRTVGTAQSADGSMCQAWTTMCQKEPAWSAELLIRPIFTIFSEYLLCAGQPCRCWPYSSEQNKCSLCLSQPGRGDWPLTKDHILNISPNRNPSSGEGAKWTPTGRPV